MTRSFRIIASLLPQDFLLRLRADRRAAFSASLSLIDFPNPSYLSPCFEVQRVEVYLHLNGLVERRRVEPLQIVEERREQLFRPREYRLGVLASEYLANVDMGCQLAQVSPQ